MARKHRWGRRRKAGRPDTTTAAEPTDNPNDPPNYPENTATVEKGKDPPHPNLLSKESNLSINPDSGSNVGLDFNASSVDDCCNLDLGSNVVPQCNEENNEKCGNCNEEGKETTIRKLQQKKSESEK